MRTANEGIGVVLIRSPLLPEFPLRMKPVMTKPDQCLCHRGRQGWPLELRLHRLLGVTTQVRRILPHVDQMPGEQDRTETYKMVLPGQQGQIAMFKTALHPEIVTMEKNERVVLMDKHQLLPY